MRNNKKGSLVADLYEFLHCFPDFTEKSDNSFNQFSHDIHPFTNNRNKRTKSNCTALCYFIYNKFIILLSISQQLTKIFSIFPPFYFY